MERTEVAIVGAGPAGLATGARLRRAGIEPVVLERGQVGDAWRTRYDRLHLHTVRWLSGLPGMGIPRTAGRWVPRDALVEYFERYAVANRLDVRTGVSVERIDPGFLLRTSTGELEARAVVVATGNSNQAFVPDWPGRDRYRGELVHSSRYANPAPYAGKDVLVVGSGNSGAEIAVDVAEGGATRVRLAVRTPPAIVRRARFGVPAQLIGLAIRPLPLPVVDRLGRFLRRATIPDLAPYGLPVPEGGPYSRFLESHVVPIVDVGIVDAVQQGTVEVVAGVTELDETGVVLADGTRIQPDAVIAATGFRPALEPLVGHLGVLDSRGDPHGPAVEGLYFTGFEPQLGGLLRELRRESRVIAKAIAAGRPMEAGAPVLSG